MSQVTVKIRTQRIEVNPVTSAITVINAGPIGPAGIDGGSAATYNHEQTTPNASWVINHNLGFYPNVTAFDDIGRVIEAAEIHHSVNQLEIQLLSPRAGTARLS